MAPASSNYQVAVSSFYNSTYSREVYNLDINTKDCSFKHNYSMIIPFLNLKPKSSESPENCNLSYHWKRTSEQSRHEMAYDLKSNVYSFRSTASCRTELVLPGLHREARVKDDSRFLGAQREDNLQGRVTVSALRDYDGSLRKRASDCMDRYSVNQNQLDKYKVNQNSQNKLNVISASPCKMKLDDSQIAQQLKNNEALQSQGSQRYKHRDVDYLQMQRTQTCNNNVRVDLTRKNTSLDVGLDNRQGSDSLMKKCIAEEGSKQKLDDRYNISTDRCAELKNYRVEERSNEKSSVVKHLMDNKYMDKVVSGIEAQNCSQKHNTNHSIDRFILEHSPTHPQHRINGQPLPHSSQVSISELLSNSQTSIFPLIPHSPSSVFGIQPMAAAFAAAYLLHPSSAHSSKKLFSCSQCRYVTDRKNNLKRHVLTMHQRCDKNLECCGVVFTSKALLRDHVAIFHGNGYMCRYCGRNFCRKALLKRHLTVHSGVKEFTCGICDYATSHKSNLERHRKVHERNDSIRVPSGDLNSSNYDDDYDDDEEMMSDVDVVNMTTDESDDNDSDNDNRLVSVKQNHRINTEVAESNPAKDSSERYSGTNSTDSEIEQSKQEISPINSLYYTRNFTENNRALDKNYEHNSKFFPLYKNGEISTLPPVTSLRENIKLNNFEIEKLLQNDSNPAWNSNLDRFKRLPPGDLDSSNYGKTQHGERIPYNIARCEGEISNSNVFNSSHSNAGEHFSNLHQTEYEAKEKINIKSLKLLSAQFNEDPPSKLIPHTDPNYSAQMIEKLRARNSAFSPDKIDNTFLMNEVRDQDITRVQNRSSNIQSKYYSVRKECVRYPENIYDRSNLNNFYGNLNKRDPVSHDFKAVLPRSEVHAGVDVGHKESGDLNRQRKKELMKILSDRGHKNKILETIKIEDDNLNDKYRPTDDFDEDIDVVGLQEEQKICSEKSI